MNFLIKTLEENKKFQELTKQISKTGPIAISGLVDVEKLHVLAGIFNETKRPMVLVTYNEIQARKLYQDLKKLIKQTYFFPKKEITSYDYVAQSKEIEYKRIDVLNKMYLAKQQKEPIIIVTTIEAVMQKMIAKKTLYKNILKLKVGSECKLEDLKKYLVSLGYERSDMVEGRGQFAVRGGIVDISLTEKYGTRIELWGDEVDSIRKFEILSQRSTEMSDSIDIYPCHEFILETDIDDIKHKMDSYKKCSEEDKELICSGNYLSKIDKYFDLFYENQANFLDYISDKYLLILDEETKIKQRIDNIKIDNNNLIKSIAEKGRIIPDAIESISDYSYDIADLNHINIEKTDASYGNNVYYFKYRDVNYYRAETEILLNTLKESIDLKKKVVILGGNEENARKLSLLLTDNDIPHRYIKNINNVNYGEVVVTTGALSSGFECKDTKLLVISSEEFFTTKTKKRKANNVFKQSEKVVFADLRIGDYVVHKVHGIGQYIGVNTIKTGEITKDYIKIRYRDDDILYVQ